MATIGFFNCVSTQPRATEESVKSIRQFHPDTFFMIACDAGPDYYDLCKKYNIEYYHSQTNLSYPVQPFGYRKEKILEWLSRFYIACVKTNTTHLMMVEDDVVLVKPVTVEDDWEVAAHDTTKDNKFPDQFNEIIERFSGVKPHVTGYGAGGGAIFKVSTFLENYWQITEFIRNNADYIQDNIYPTMGWMDCYMTYFYLLSGKKYTNNPHLFNIWPTDKNFDLTTVPEEIQIVHNYKKYYD
jgi:hypothetical protein